MEERGIRSGWKVKKVNPHGTSNYCPRSVKQVRKVVIFTLIEQHDNDRCFYCPHCYYRADRDYIGALNVYRKYREKARMLIRKIGSSLNQYIENKIA